MQNRLHRYMARRFGDHPALFAWKLWSEINLTDAYSGDLPAWHKQAAQSFKDHDPYQRMVTTHWSGDWQRVDHRVASISELDFICIDAYHQINQPDLATLFYEGMNSRRRRNLSALNKPIVITEYGGFWDAAPEPQMIAEHSQDHGLPW